MANQTIARVRRFDPTSMPVPTPVQCAWAAGVLEGEGCIRIQVVDVTDSKTRRRLKDRATMSVVLAMKDERVVCRFADLFGARANQRSDGMWIVTLSSGRALWVLQLLTPHMWGDKLPQAVLAAEFQVGRTPGHRKPERHAWELDAAKRISEMKKVGIYARRKGPRSRIDERIERSGYGEQPSV